MRKRTKVKAAIPKKLSNLGWLENEIKSSAEKQSINNFEVTQEHKKRRKVQSKIARPDYYINLQYQD